MKFVYQQIASNQLPHALLFVSQTDNHQAVQALADFLLCEKKQNNQACGHCKSCHLLAANNHPDYCVIKPEGKSQTIPIDTIRDLADFCFHTPQCADKKIIVIFDADKMNIAASNALLKTLEEPAENTYFLLTSKIPAAIPATIKSRCQITRMPYEEQGSVIEWRSDLIADCLALNAGKLNPLVMAQKWQKQDPILLLDELYAYFAQKQQFSCLDSITHFRKNLLQHPSINVQLQLESLLITIK